MQSICIFVNIAKFANFGGRNADDSKNKGLPHVIYIFFVSTLGKL